jgi:dTDP-glucose pyrophosphorylase
MKPTLVLLAAGIGNRYGGLKQMEKVGPSGETIIDYSIYDAVRTGFGKVVFVIRKSIEEEFNEVFLAKLKGKLDIDYVFQELKDVPAGLKVSPDRVKPWGTSQAVLVAEPKVREPFAAINADDFYGRQAFEVMADFLGGLRNGARLYSLVGYQLGSTLSAHGSVARGVCEVDKAGMLKSIVERTSIEKTTDGARFRDETGHVVILSGRETVSMNFWGFTPSFFKYAKTEFGSFVRNNINNPKAELYIPTVINKLIKTGKARVKVLECGERWFGVTYKEDRPQVVQAIHQLVSAGKYPSPLWG